MTITTDRLTGHTLTVISDSFGTALAGIAPYTQTLADERDMHLDERAAAGGSWAQDGAGRAIGTAATLTPRPPEDVVLIGFGINPALQSPTDPTRSAERDALAALLWLAASDHRRVGGWSTSGPWSTYTGPGSERMSGGQSLVCDQGGASAQTVPPPGRYVALGYTYAAGVGAFAQTGRWEVGGRVVTGSVSSQHGEHASAPTAQGGKVAHRPVLLGDLDGQTVVGVSVEPSAGYTFVGDLLRLTPTPPWIVVVKPTYSRPLNYTVNDGAIDRARADIDRTVAQVTASHPPLRGRIVVVDPVTSGWSRDEHTAPDGLHPNAAGHRFLTDLVSARIDAAQDAYARDVELGRVG